MKARRQRQTQLGQSSASLRARWIRGTGVAPENGVLWGVLGFGLAYFVFVPHGFAHPLHWLVAAGGALLGVVAFGLYCLRGQIDAFVSGSRKGVGPGRRL